MVFANYSKTTILFIMLGLANINRNRCGS